MTTIKIIYINTHIMIWLALSIVACFMSVVINIHGFNFNSYRDQAKILFIVFRFHLIIMFYKILFVVFFLTKRRIL